MISISIIDQFPHTQLTLSVTALPSHSLLFSLPNYKPIKMLAKVHRIWQVWGCFFLLFLKSNFPPRVSPSLSTSSSLGRGQLTKFDFPTNNERLALCTRAETLPQTWQNKGMAGLRTWPAPSRASNLACTNQGFEPFLYHQECCMDYMNLISWRYIVIN